MHERGGVLGGSLIASAIAYYSARRLQDAATKRR
jgi:hypothetical protein